MNIDYSINFLLFPFTFECMEGHDLWEPVQNRADLSLLHRMVSAAVTSDSNITLLKLRNDDIRHCELERLLKNTNTSLVSTTEKEPITIAENARFFCGDDDVTGSPTIVLHSTQNLAILVLPLKYKIKTIEEMCNINYAVRKLDHQRIDLVPDFKPLLVATQKDNGNEVLKQHVVALKGLMNEIRQQKETERLEFKYSIKDLRNFLLKDFKTPCFYNDERANVFSYSNGTDNDLNNDDLANLIRLQHGMGHKYDVNIDEMKKQMLWTFRNIVMGASSECAFLLTHADKTASSFGFFNNFHTTSLPRYFFVYLIVVMQQQLLVAATKKLMKADTKPSNVSLRTTTDMIDEIVKMKNSLQFVEISALSNMNSYHNYCIKQLNVEKHYANCQSKLADMNKLIARGVEERRYGLNLMMTTALALLTIFQGTSSLIDTLVKNKWIEEGSCATNAITVFTWIVGGIVFAIIYIKLRK